MPYEILPEPVGRYEMLPPEQPAAVKAGSVLNDIPRQLGLAARYGVEGLANTAQIVTEPVRQLITDPLVKLFGGAPGRPLGEVATRAADAVGLPSPQGANERVVADATRLLAGGGGLAGAARLATALPGAAGAVANGLSANLPQQLGSAAGAGLAGGASREAGGGPLMQAGAALAGGVAGGLVPGMASAAANVARNAVTKAPTPQALDAQISVIMQRAGQDYSQVPERVRQNLRAELADSLRAGKEIDPAAVRRLADFVTVGATPTRGMVSQNPVQITREMNLAKMGANSSDEALHGLPMVQNQNNSTLIRNLNQSGATEGDPFRAGQAAIGSIAARDAELGREVTNLYGTARNMAGGDIPLNRKPVVDAIFGDLARENKMAFLPEPIGKMLNNISAGSIRANGQDFEVPFTAQTLDSLKTMIATAQRGTQDGNVKAALSIVRKAIDNTGIDPLKTQFGGNQVVTQGGANFLRNQDAQAGDYMGALNQARAAAASRFGWQESSRPVEAALGGAAPDKFVQQFVIGGTLRDAEAVAAHAPVEVKNAILAHLKEKALGGASDEVGKFSQSAYNKALSQIGDRKLGVFFSPEELTQLKTLGRVASYTQVQPVGSAVNNSNSGALLLGRGYDALKGLAGKIPGGQMLVADPLKNIEISLRSGQAMNVAPGLLSPIPRQPLGQSLLLPGIAAGRLLAAP